MYIFSPKQCFKHLCHFVIRKKMHHTVCHSLPIFDISTNSRLLLYWQSKHSDTVYFQQWRDVHVWSALVFCESLVIGWGYVSECATGFSYSKRFYDLSQILWIWETNKSLFTSIAFTFIIVISECFTPQHFAAQCVGSSKRCSDSLPALLGMCMHKHECTQSAVKLA